ncbi:hypothetical protein [Actinophytocola sp.]|uniref:hypothetical protein n=1 Tax=Actinophytocola sp. TaxID=1872138 RepID=UPI002DDD7B97|nr:hypothetical protein [Actinophytocola sp.]
MNGRAVDPTTGKPTTRDATQPYSPDAISRRYKRMATNLGINTHIHGPTPLLRH